MTGFVGFGRLGSLGFASCSLVHHLLQSSHNDDPHHGVTHDESVDSLPETLFDDAEIKMKGGTTPMRVLLVVDSSTGYLGATDVD